MIPLIHLITTRIYPTFGCPITLPIKPLPLVSTLQLVAFPLALPSPHARLFSRAQGTHAWLQRQAREARGTAQAASQALMGASTRTRELEARLQATMPSPPARLNPSQPARLHDCTARILPILHSPTKLPRPLHPFVTTLPFPISPTLTSHISSSMRPSAFLILILNLNLALA